MQIRTCILLAQQQSMRLPCEKQSRVFHGGAVAVTALRDSRRGHVEK